MTVSRVTSYGIERYRRCRWRVGLTCRYIINQRILGRILRDIGIGHDLLLGDRKILENTMLYDPPSGWKYGFPKEYKPLPGETLAQTLLRDGYPQQEIDAGNAKHVRFLGGSYKELMELSGDQPDKAVPGE